MANPLDNFASRLANFGVLTGLKITPQGARALLAMGTPEVARILEALTEIEAHSVSPDEELLASLKRTRALIEDRWIEETAPLYEITAEVVVTAREIRFEQVMPDALTPS